MFLKRGFTIIELMVVIAVMSILAAVVFVASFDSGEKSRDAKRQADLRALQTAVELYKLKYGQYPAGCHGVTANTTGVNHISTNQNNHWSGQSGSYACASGNQYIMGHVDTNDFDQDGNTTEVFSLAPEFIPVLPVDPKVNSASANSGYVYTTNSDYTAYKIMAFDTVESESVSFDHELFRCGKSPAAVNTYGGHACNVVPNNFTGTFGYNTGSQASLPTQCTTANIYSNDYAVFGGYSDGETISGNFRDTVRAREYFTDIIHCK